ncbi:hypothetical protein [Marinagarivorans cellulosilyticus]|uniref:Uncharacterized protein n=1 Tax=Marinagarivorans cellulosilyticus TaxID=2721545 RepID=A0AAN2BM08_9GAMM|nr:hypothetical protein [Marinagarivorans cellulosilyticus]BCD99649.1 hypothetical protein MARGE09_P3851 [Marinagarivorans cellulosilyticus]
MDSGEIILNALGVNQKAESELISIAIHYEILFKQRLNWIIDTGQCIQVLNQLTGSDNKDLQERILRFHKALNVAEKKYLAKKGLTFPFGNKRSVNARSMQKNSAN